MTDVPERDEDPGAEGAGPTGKDPDLAPAAADYGTTSDRSPARTPSAPGQHPVDPPEGLLDAAVAVISEPVITLRRVVAHPNVGWAVIITVIVGALSGAATAAGFGGAGGDELQIGTDLERFRGLLVVGGLIGGPITSLILLAIWSAIVLGIGRLLKGSGQYQELFTALAFANVPSVLNVPAQLLALAGTAGAVLSGLASFAIAVWVIVLSVLAVREAHRFSTGRAVATVLIPLAVLFVVVIAFIVFLVVALLGGA